MTKNRADNIVLYDFIALIREQMYNKTVRLMQLLTKILINITKYIKKLLT